MATTKYRATGADLNRLLRAAEYPFTVGDIVYRLVPDGAVANSIKDAEQHVSRAGVEFVLKELHTNGAVARHTGAEWAEMGISFYDQRPTGTYYALASKTEEWLRQRAERKEKALAKKNDAQAHEQAVAALITRHQDEYDRIFEAFRTGAETTLDERPEEPETPGLDELMVITFHGLDQLVTADVRLTHQLHLGEHLASGTLRAKVIDVTQGLGDPGPPLVDVAIDWRVFPGMTAEHVIEELQHTPGVSDAHVDEARCMGSCCPPSVPSALKVLPEDTDPMTLGPGDLVRHPDHGTVEVQERFTALRTDGGIVADGRVYHLPTDKIFVVRWEYDDLVEDRIGDHDMYVLQEQTGPASWSRADLMDGSTARAGITYDRLNRQAIITEVQPGEYRVTTRQQDDQPRQVSRYIREDLLQSQESSS